MQLVKLKLRALFDPLTSDKLSLKYVLTSIYGKLKYLISLH